MKKIPNRLTTELVCAMVYWINCATRKDGVHRAMSPRMIMTGQRLSSKNVMFQFGDFVQATEPPRAPTTVNSMDERTSDAIYCRPSGNNQGGFWAYKLSTNQMVHRNTAILSHSTDIVRDQLELIATNEEAPDGLVFGDRNGHAVTIQDYDDDVNNVVIEDHDDDMSDDEFQDSNEYQIDGDHDLSDDESINPDPDYQYAILGVDDDSSDGEQQGSDNDAGEEQQQFFVDDNDALSDEDNEQPWEEVTGPRRSARLATSSQVYFQAVDQYEHIDATMSSKQYGMNAGLKVFGQAGYDAITSEIKDNLHGRGVIDPVKSALVGRKIRMEALSYLMFLKRKRCGRIKGRGCADGRKQREFISKEEASSPTVSTHALMATCLIDATEGRDVATVDIPGAFLQADMDEDVWIKFEGPMVDVLLEIVPERYGPCVIHYKGKKFLYAKAMKAIYGTLRAALLFYELFSGTLTGWGFKKNPYDACTMNKMVNGKQLTVVWHVDDCKISHVDPNVVTSLIHQLEEKFGKESKMTVNRGASHDHLGMTIDYSIKGKVKFYMFDYIEQVLGEVDPSMMKGSSITPAASHLFNVNEAATKLSNKDGDQFHRSVAQLLFLSKRARPDLQTAVAFLCTRVKAPDVDDQRKLGRVMRHLRETIFLPLVLGADGTGNIYWSVDASFAVHNDMKSHTGGVMTLGTGALIAMSTKQKLNTTSSTEAELVGVSDSMPFNMWATYFFKEQGGNIGVRNILFQDNESCIKLAMNGKASSSRRTRHIHIRYFAVTDRVKNGEIEIHYCPTKEMLGDYFTKPLQG